MLCPRICSRLDPTDDRVRVCGYIHEYAGFLDAVADELGDGEGDGGEFDQREVIAYSFATHSYGIDGVSNAV